MKKILIIVVTLIVLAIAGLLTYNLLYTPSISNWRVAEALEFCKKHNLNTDYCVFVDFSKHAGKKRYVLYDLNDRKVVCSSVCANGFNPIQSNDRFGIMCTTEPTPLCSQKTWNRPAFYSFSLHDYEKDIEIFGGYEIITYICSIKQIKQ